MVGEASPLQLLLRHWDRRWFAQEVADLWGHNSVLNKCFRHAKGGRIRALEDIYIEHYGEDWKEQAADLQAWDKSRAEFLRATLQRAGCRADSALQGLGGEAWDGGVGGQWVGAKEGRGLVRDQQRQQEGRATLEEVWQLPSMSGAQGFVAVVDSANVAGWLSGRRAVGQRGGEEVVGRVEQAWDTLELLAVHLGSPPLATEWVVWVPREENKGADWLATRALETGDAWFWHGQWARFQKEEIVIFSDAGVRQRGDGQVSVGLGWSMFHRATGRVVAAASWRLTMPPEQGDVNRWELQAALAGLGALLFLRTGRVGEVWPGSGECEVLAVGDIGKVEALVGVAGGGKSRGLRKSTPLLCFLHLHAIWFEASWICLAVVFGMRKQTSLGWSKSVSIGARSLFQPPKWHGCIKRVHL